MELSATRPRQALSSSVIGVHMPGCAAMGYLSSFRWAPRALKPNCAQLPRAARQQQHARQVVAVTVGERSPSATACEIAQIAEYLQLTLGCHSTAPARRCSSSGIVCQPYDVSFSW